MRCAQKTRNDDLGRCSFALADGIGEVFADLIEQSSCLGHKIGEGVGEIVDSIPLAGRYSHQGTPSEIGVRHAAYRLDAYPFACGLVIFVGVVE